MKNEQFKQVVKEAFEIIEKRLHGSKAAKYADSSHDRLSHFKQVSLLTGQRKYNALAGEMVKHTVTLYDYLHRYSRYIDVDYEDWKETIFDHICYLILLWSLIQEEQQEQEQKEED